MASAATATGLRAVHLPGPGAWGPPSAHWIPILSVPPGILLAPPGSRPWCSAEGQPGRGWGVPSRQMQGLWAPRAFLQPALHPCSPLARGCPTHAGRPEPCPPWARVSPSPPARRPWGFLAPASPPYLPGPLPGGAEPRASDSATDPVRGLRPVSLHLPEVHTESTQSSLRGAVGVTPRMSA